MAPYYPSSNDRSKLGNKWAKPRQTGPTPQETAIAKAKMEAQITANKAALKQMKSKSKFTLMPVYKKKPEALDMNASEKLASRPILPSRTQVAASSQPKRNSSQAPYANSPEPEKRSHTPASKSGSGANKSKIDKPLDNKKTSTRSLKPESKTKRSAVHKSKIEKADSGSIQPLLGPLVSMQIKRNELAISRIVSQVATTAVAFKAPMLSDAQIAERKREKAAASERRSLAKTAALTSASSGVIQRTLDAQIAERERQKAYASEKVSLPRTAAPASTSSDVIPSMIDTQNTELKRQKEAAIPERVSLPRTTPLAFTSSRVIQSMIRPKRKMPPTEDRTKDSKRFRPEIKDRSQAAGPYSPAQADISTVSNAIDENKHANIEKEKTATQAWISPPTPIATPFDTYSVSSSTTSVTSSVPATLQHISPPTPGRATTEAQETINPPTTKCEAREIAMGSSTSSTSTGSEVSALLRQPITPIARSKNMIEGWLDDIYQKAQEASAEAHLQSDTTLASSDRELIDSLFPPEPTTPIEGDDTSNPGQFFIDELDSDSECDDLPDIQPPCIHDLLSPQDRQRHNNDVTQKTNDVCKNFMATTTGGMVYIRKVGKVYDASTGQEWNDSWSVEDDE